MTRTEPRVEERLAMINTVAYRGVTGQSNGEQRRLTSTTELMIARLCLGGMLVHRKQYIIRTFPLFSKQDEQYTNGR